MILLLSIIILIYMIYFLHTLMLSLSNSPTPDLTAMLSLTYTLLVKSGTHSLYLFSQLPLTCILSNALHLDTSATIDQDRSFPIPVEFGRPLAFDHRRRY